MAHVKLSLFSTAVYVPAGGLDLPASSFPQHSTVPSVLNPQVL
jgi:hypothetical protein